MTDNGKEQAHVKEAIKDQMLVSGDLATQRGSKGDLPPPYPCKHSSQ